MAVARVRILEIARYVSVGIGLVGIEYAIYLALIKFSPVAPVVAHIAGRSLAAVIGYFGHAHFTFRQANDHGRRAPRYLLVFLSNIAFSTVLLQFFLTILDPVRGKIVTDVIAAGGCYLATRLVVFDSTASSVEARGSDE